jgi:hypothetical protein
MNLSVVASFYIFLYSPIVAVFCLKIQGGNPNFSKKFNEKECQKFLLEFNLVRVFLIKRPCVLAVVLNIKWVYVFSALQTGFSTLVKVSQICYD